MTISMLKEMTDDDRLEYFRDLGFEGAYSLRNKADVELDKIFDNEGLDSCEFRQEIYSYIDKYKGLFKFKSEEDCSATEEWDVSPYLTFDDDDMQYVGSIDGYVVIANELVGPKNINLLDATPSGPINTKIVKTCEVCVNHGKYKSFLSVGRKGLYFAFKVQTYRKKGFTTKHDNNCYHIGNLEISDSKHVGGANINHRRGEYTLPWEIKSFDMKVKIQITDFHDLGHPDEKVSKTFTDVIMK